MNLKLKILIAAILIIKSAVLFTNADLSTMNNDEESNYYIANNYLSGNNYTNKYDRLSSFHGSFQVFVYKQLIQYKIPKKAYILLVHIIALIAFLISIAYFNKILIYLQLPNKWSFISTIVYSLYPSNLIYIGNHFNYEKIVLPLLIIILYYFLKTIKTKVSLSQIWFIPFMVVLCCLLRAQLFFIFLFIYAIYLLAYPKNSQLYGQKAYIALATIFLTLVTHAPILQKNKLLFGEYMLSTQMGYELMQGHNDLARGSWFGYWWKEGSPYLAYSKQVIPDLESLNEYEEGIARQQFALNWIKENPMKEIKLIVKKTAIFFLPKNYESHRRFNLINALVHFGFIAALLWAFLKRQFEFNSFMILAPIVSTYVLSLIFFVGYRWRFYAEPFFIIYVTYQLNKYIRNMKTFRLNRGA